MKLRNAFVALLGLFVATAAVNAQVLYQQDFSATFPNTGEVQPGLVTVIMTNESGDVIIPFQDYPIVGLSGYVGRPQVAARTGGANANQEVSSIQSTYTVGGANTNVVYDAADFVPGGNGAFTPEEGYFEDGFVALSADGVNDTQSAAAWDEGFSEVYNSAQHDFIFRISGAGDPANDQADGLGFAYLRSSIYDTTGASGPGISEEPAFTDSFGVGFDIWDNGGEGGNSVSLHYNGRLIESRPIDAGTTNPDTGEDWAFNSFETDELISTSILIQAGDELGGGVDPVLKGGSPYTVWNRSGRAPELQRVGGDGSMEGYLRVVEEASGVANVVAFDSDGSDALSGYEVSFNFRGLSEEGSRADGMSFLLVPTDLYDTTGATTIDFGPHEEPNLAGAFGVGFDTFNSDADAQDDPEGMANTGNHVSVHFDGQKESQTNLALEDINLVTTDPEVWHTATISILGDDVVVILNDGVDGSEHLVFADTIAGLSQMGAVRPVFAARTGGAFDHYEIDNFLMCGPEGCGGEGIRGDFNGDGQLDASDINDLTEQSASGANVAAYDLTGDGLVNAADVAEWITAGDIFNSWIGDANLDGEFNTSDFVAVFTVGKYETGQDAVWTEGDWNGDGVFGTADFVTAFQGGGYEQGMKPAAAVSAVPEPSSLVLLALGSLLMIRRRK